jgi:hypothetical protein
VPTARLACGHGDSLEDPAGSRPGTERQTREEVAGWPDFDPDFAEVPGLIEPFLSAIHL